MLYVPIISWYIFPVSTALDVRLIFNAEAGALAMTRELELAVEACALVDEGRKVRSKGERELYRVHVPS